MSQLTEYLSAELAMMKKLRSPLGGGKYLTIGDFVLQHGREFKAATLPAGVTRGPMRQCFKNSQEWALFHQNGQALTYCEGYALGVIPVHHAWLCNADGEVIERTWRESGLGSGVEYFGIPFQTEFVRAQVLRTECWNSILDDWENGWPLIAKTPPVNVWRAKL